MLSMLIFHYKVFEIFLELSKALGLEVNIKLKAGTMAFFTHLKIIEYIPILSVGSRHSYINDITEVFSMVCLQFRTL